MNSNDEGYSGLLTWLGLRNFGRLDSDSLTWSHISPKVPNCHYICCRVTHGLFQNKLVHATF